MVEGKMEMKESEFTSLQLNKMIVRMFDDGTISFFVNKEMTPFTFRKESADNLKQLLIDYSKEKEDEISKDNDKLAKELSESLDKVRVLTKKLEAYQEIEPKIKELRQLKSKIIKEIETIKPDTRRYICTNGIVHNDEVVIDVKEFREQIKGKVVEVLE